MPNNAGPTAKILLVDDEALALRMYSYIINEAELGQTIQCSDSRQVMNILYAESVDLVLLDLNMPYLGGREVLENIAGEFPDIPVFILTNEDRIEVAVECMKVGAFDFMTKPIDRNRLISAVRHALTIRELKREVNILSSRREERPLVKPEAFSHIITQSGAMMTIFAYIEAIAPSPKAVLVTGESGTGKELIARVIHELSGRPGRYVPLNVSGLDDTIFSDSLFGHLRGAYTGADSVRKGLVDQAKDGTLFMDEIGDMETAPQIKLLRLLQEGEYYPLGSDAPQKSRARIVAATNADLHRKQALGAFRKDLYYRLIAHHIEVPPLRERSEDIELLTRHFAKDAAVILKKQEPFIEKEAFDLLRTYSFPGNIRELQAMVFDAVSREEKPVLSAKYFEMAVNEKSLGSLQGKNIRQLYSQKPSGQNFAAQDFQGGEVKNLVIQEMPGEREQPFVEPSKRQLPAESGGTKLKSSVLQDGEKDPQFIGPAGMILGKKLPTLQEVENFLYAEALRRAGGNQTLAAQLLGVSQSTLSRWLRNKQGSLKSGGET